MIVDRTFGTQAVPTEGETADNLWQAGMGREMPKGRGIHNPLHKMRKLSEKISFMRSNWGVSIIRCYSDPAFREQTAGLGITCLILVGIEVRIYGSA